MFFVLCMLAIFQLVLIYLAYTLANRGEEISAQHWKTCAIIITGFFIGAFWGIRNLAEAYHVWIYLGYVVVVGIAFHLGTELTLKRTVLATAIYFIFFAIARFLFKLLFF